MVNEQSDYIKFRLTTVSRQYKTYGFYFTSVVKQTGVEAIERVDTAIISDESVRTNQFLGSNRQVALLVSLTLALNKSVVCMYLYQTYLVYRS